VQFTTTALALASQGGQRRQLDKKLLALSRPKLLIVEELGYPPLETDAAPPVL